MTVPFYIFYLPLWWKNNSFTYFIFRCGGRTFLFTYFIFRCGGRTILSHILSSAAAEERSFYIFYLPPWRKNNSFTFFIFRHGGRTFLSYFTIFRHGGRAFFFILPLSTMGDECSGRSQRIRVRFLPASMRRKMNSRRVKPHSDEPP